MNEWRYCVCALCEGGCEFTTDHPSRTCRYCREHTHWAAPGPWGGE